jgi:hypothetical protein
MSLSGSTALARVAMNPGCSIQVAMCLSGRPENRFFESVTGEQFLAEFGERQSARRRGSQFEKNLFSPPGDARLLHNSLHVDPPSAKPLKSRVLPGPNGTGGAARYFASDRPRIWVRSSHAPVALTA